MSEQKTKWFLYILPTLLFVVGLILAWKIWKALAEAVKI